MVEFLEAQALQVGFGLAAGAYDGGGQAHAFGVVLGGATPLDQQGRRQFGHRHHAALGRQQAFEVVAQFGELRRLEPAFTGLQQRAGDLVAVDGKGRRRHAQGRPQRGAFGLFQAEVDGPARLLRDGRHRPAGVAAAVRPVR